MCCSRDYSFRAEQPQFSEIAIAEPPQETATQLLLVSNNVERLRAEQNQLRTKLKILTKGKEVSDDKSLNASTSASSGHGRSSDETNRDASNDVSMQPNESSIGSRARPTRHHFEGTPGIHFVPAIHIMR